MLVRFIPHSVLRTKQFTLFVNRHDGILNFTPAVPNVRKHKHLPPSSASVTSAQRQKMMSLSTDEVLERIQQQMAEVMATAQEVANSAVTNENEARQQVGGDDDDDEFDVVVTPTASVSSPALASGGSGGGSSTATGGGKGK